MDDDEVLNIWKSLCELRSEELNEGWSSAFYSSHIWFSYIQNFKIKLVEKLKLDERIKEEEETKFTC